MHPHTGGNLLFLSGILSVFIASIRKYYDMNVLWQDISDAVPVHFYEWLVRGSIKAKLCQIIEWMCGVLTEFSFVFVLTSLQTDSRARGPALLAINWSSLELQYYCSLPFL